LIGVLDMYVFHLVFVPSWLLPSVHACAYLKRQGICKQALRYRSKHSTFLPISRVCSRNAAAAGLIISCAAELPLPLPDDAPSRCTFPTVKPCPVCPDITVSSPFCE